MTTPKLAKWMTDAGFERYTGYSTDTLEAITASQDASIEERVFAFIVRFSWSWDRAAAMKMADGQVVPLLQSDIAAKLKIDKRIVSEAVIRLKRRGWLREAKKLLYPVPVPSGPQVDPESEAAPEPQPERTWDEYIEQLKDFDPFEYREIVSAREVFNAAKTNLLAKLNAHKREFREFKKSGTSRTFEEAKSPEMYTEPSPEMYTGKVRDVQKFSPPDLITAQPLTEQQQHEVSVALHEYSRVVTPQTVNRLIEDCRAASPGSGSADVAETIRYLGRKMSGGVKNPIGVLLTAVPQTLAAYRKRKAAEAETASDKEGEQSGDHRYTPMTPEEEAEWEKAEMQTTAKAGGAKR